MDYSSLPIRSIVFSMSAFGALIGLMVGLGRDPINKNHIWLYISSFSVFFAWIGWRIIKWMAERTEDTIYYESETKALPQENTGRVILSLTIIANGANRTIQLHGLEEEEWYQLGDGVVGRGYKYTLRDLQDIFNATNGSRIYGRITQKLGDTSVCVLTPSGSNGWAVTEEIGKKFFDGLHDRQLEVLEILNQ